jgi:hypothetical protein
MGEMTERYLAEDYENRRAVADLSRDELLAERTELDTAEHEIRNLIDDGRPRPETEDRPSAAQGVQLHDRLQAASARLHALRQELTDRRVR